VVSVASRGKECALLGVFQPIFVGFFANFAALKNFIQNLSVPITFVLDGTYVPNLTFLGILITLQYITQQFLRWRKVKSN